jgi:hypothetical protein
VDDKGDGDGWEVQDDWAPIENLEQDSFGTSFTTVRSKDSVLMVNANKIVDIPFNVLNF